MNLRETWLNLAKHGAHPAAAPAIYDGVIVPMHSQPHKYYHNLSHPDFMFNLIDQLNPPIENFVAVGYSIFGHDIDWHPDNLHHEETGAHLTVSLMHQIGLPLEIIHTSHDLIMVTKEHRGTTPDQCLIIDLDLAGLGQDQSGYAAYAQAIRLEYSHLTDTAFAAGRIRRFLEPMLARDRIFQTDQFYTLYEGQARDNLARELEFQRQFFA